MTYVTINKEKNWRRFFKGLSQTMMDANWWHKLMWPLARWAKKAVENNDSSANVVPFYWKVCHMWQVVVETTGFVDFCQKYTNQANFYK
jgi:hypothetical protein